MSKWNIDTYILESVWKDALPSLIDYLLCDGRIIINDYERQSWLQNEFDKLSDSIATRQPTHTFATGKTVKLTGVKRISATLQEYARPFYIRRDI